MRHPVRTGAALAAVTLGASAGPALAGTFTLGLTQQSPAVVGRPLIIQATGTTPLEALGYAYWFNLDAIPARVTTTCPPDKNEGAQFAVGTGGALVAFDQIETPNAAGAFTIPVAVTPTAPGSLLLCGYTDDGATETLAAASLLLDISPASSGPASPPAAPVPATPPSTPSPASPPGKPAARSHPQSPPAYAAAGIKSCRALLTGADARSCIRKIVRTAEARCRRLPSRKRCLRAVRRSARSSP